MAPAPASAITVSEIRLATPACPAGRLPPNELLQISSVEGIKRNIPSVAFETLSNKLNRPIVWPCFRPRSYALAIH